MTFRLPTEAQWEYACRAGTSTAFNFMSTTSTDQVIGDERSQNAWGLYGMNGYVWEWCSDWYAPNIYNKSPTDDPENTEPSGNRVLRGGGWIHMAWVGRSAGRINCDPDHRYEFFGSRLALEFK